MKNKIFMFFFVTTFIICFYNVKVNAATISPNNSNSCALIITSNNKYILFVPNDNDTNINIGPPAPYKLGIGYTGNINENILIGYISSYSDYTSAVNAFLNNNAAMELSNNGWLITGQVTTIVMLKGTCNNKTSLETVFNSLQDYEDYLNPPPPPPSTWYEELWEDFTDFVNVIENSLGEYFGITPLMDFFDDLWTVKVGEGEDQLTKFPLATPTPIPPTPTPIPYQTILTPDGNGGYSINYYYNNPSGTPIITSSPPVNGNTSEDNNFEYPYYENPDNIDNPYEFNIPWYLKLILKGNNVDVDQLDDEYKIAEQTIQSDEVLNAVDNIYDGFQVIPSDWLMILGAIAALPLFAALIHRMLNG